MQLIKISQDSPYFKFTTELGGVSYTLSFRWNRRAGQWVLDFGDGDGTVLKAGIRCVVNVLLLARNGFQLGLPAGYLVFYDTTEGGRDMEYSDLGRRVVLVYIAADELLPGLEEAAAAAE